MVEASLRVQGVLQRSLSFRHLQSVVLIKTLSEEKVRILLLDFNDKIVWVSCITDTLITQNSGKVASALIISAARYLHQQYWNLFASLVLRFANFDI